MKGKGKRKKSSLAAIDKILENRGRKLFMKQCMDLVMVRMAAQERNVGKEVNKKEGFR